MMALVPPFKHFWCHAQGLAHARLTKQSTSEGTAPAPEDVSRELALRQDVKRGKAVADQEKEHKLTGLWKRESPLSQADDAKSMTCFPGKSVCVCVWV